LKPHDYSIRVKLCGVLAFNIRASLQTALAGSLKRW
jgi:hypothetical protein